MATWNRLFGEKATYHDNRLAGSEFHLAHAIKKEIKLGIPKNWKSFECKFFEISYPSSWTLRTGEQLLLLPDFCSEIKAGLSEVLYSPSVTIMVAGFPDSVISEPNFLAKQPKLANEQRLGEVTSQEQFKFRGYHAVSASANFERAARDWMVHQVYCVRGSTLYYIDASGLIEDIEKSSGVLTKVLASLKIKH